jgi:hypothetical protein
LYKIGFVIDLAAFAVGCGDFDDYNTGGTPDAGGSSADAAVNGFPQPAGTVPVNFSVDDTANKVYTAGNLQWKGAMIYDEVTRKVVQDATGWDMAKWATLYDDGAWTAGGHEPVGSTAGDHKWGITVFATPPATGSTLFEYGLNDTVYQTAYGDGWSWVGANGMFTVAAGATSPITATGRTFPAFGTTDMKITVDLANLGAGDFDTSMARIKSSAWSWGLQTMTIANNKATFTLSDATGAGKPLSHTGLVSTGMKPEFIVVFGTGAGKEYKDSNNTAQTAGVTAEVKKAGGTFMTTPVVVLDNKNTSITVP